MLKTYLAVLSNVNTLIRGQPNYTVAQLHIECLGGLQRLPLCRLSPTLVTYHHEVTGIPLGDVVRLRHRGTY